MIEFYVSGQNLRVYTPVIAADTLNYLTAKVWFLGDEWAGYTRWLHFRRGEGVGTEVYDLILDGNDSITEDKGLNLTAGEWTVYLSGNREGARLTTAPVVLTVKESGLVDAPLHAMPLSVAEQIANDASAALACAREVKERAEAGAFNGRDGLSFVIAGYYDNAEALAEAVTQPQPGERRFELVGNIRRKISALPHIAQPVHAFVVAALHQVAHIVVQPRKAVVAHAVRQRFAGLQIPLNLFRQRPAACTCQQVRDQQSRSRSARCRQREDQPKLIHAVPPPSGSPRRARSEYGRVRSFHAAG